MLLRVLATACLVSAGLAAEAAPNGEKTCRKMIADGRSGGLSQADCLCRYRAADAVLDDDIKALLFDAWYAGHDNMAAMERLPGRQRVKRQMSILQRTIEKNCPGG